MLIPAGLRLLIVMMEGNKTWSNKRKEGEDTEGLGKHMDIAQKSEKV